MVSREKSYTPAGNIRTPSKFVSLCWVKKAWKSVTREVIMKSFDVCGISVSVDGEEDHKIQCVKDGEVSSAAGRLIASKTKALHEPHDLDSADPFPDLDELNEDEDQVDTNECVIEDS
uniref:DDE-1 domain-containing protein n=1 Tax=Amphimedon queenslandica TaxID=400682 RepID=A0A1X7U9Q1_AMPQE